MRLDEIHAQVRLETKMTVLQKNILSSFNQAHQSEGYLRALMVNQIQISRNVDASTLYHLVFLLEQFTDCPPACSYTWTPGSPMGSPSRSHGLQGGGVSQLGLTK